MAGINSALSGLLVAQARLGVSADNVANVKSTSTGADGSRQPYVPNQVQAASLGPNGGAMPVVLPTDFVDIQSQFSGLNQGLATSPITNREGIRPTRSISVKANIDARNSIAYGSGTNVNLSSVSGNQKLSLTDIIAAGTGGELQAGDELSIATSGGTSVTLEYGGIVTSNAADGAGGIDFSAYGGANISAINQPFLTSASSGNNAQFTIQSSSGDSITLTYNNSPNIAAGEFNSLETLAQAINSNSGFNARIAPSVTGNELLIAPADANDALTFNNSGITDFVGTLGLNNSSAGSGNRFATLGQLESLASEVGIDTQTSGESLRLSAPSALEGLTFSDNSGTERMVTALGLANPDSGGFSYAPRYDATNPSSNMSSGSVRGQFIRNFTIVDALGEEHSVTLSALTTSPGQVAVEIYAAEGSKVRGQALNTQPNLLAYGTVSFDGEGRVQDLSAALSQPLKVGFTNGAEASEIALNLSDISYYAAENSLHAIDQDGRAAGNALPEAPLPETQILSRVSLDSEAVEQMMAKQTYLANLKTIEAEKENTERLLDIFE